MKIFSCFKLCFEKQENEDVINDLPTEILVIIFKKLYRKDLENCSQTCVRWKFIIEDIWKNSGDKMIEIIFLNMRYSQQTKRPIKWICD